MNTRVHNTPEAGYTLLTTLMLTGCITAMLAATLTRTMTEEKLNDRDNAYQTAGAAAEAATEKVLSRMMVDFANGGEANLSNNLSTYRSMVPTTNENAYWTNFLFLDGNGNSNATYVARTTTAPNPPYVTLEQQYPGLNAFASTYRILSDAQYQGNTYDLTGVVQQDVQMAEIPVFQFAIFYNSLLEFSDCAPMIVNGRVHCNTNINVGCDSSSSLTFNNYEVTASGIITNPPAAGISSWGVSNIFYNGLPSPGYGTGQPILTLPIGTNSSSPTYVREIINPPTNGEPTTNSISPQRYFNKADLVILVTNAYIPSGGVTNLILWSNFNGSTTFSSNLFTNAVTVYVKNSMYDSSPIMYSVTNDLALTNTNVPSGYAYKTSWSNWAATGITNWLSTSNTFFDQREQKYLHVVQIDVGKLGQWIGTTNGYGNTNLSTKWNSTTPFNGIVYIQDSRTTNAHWLNCVRLTNGVNVTNGLYASGLTVATQNPLYIQGLYNCPTNQGSSNAAGSVPCSVICDALTILSPNWSDANSTNALGDTATVDTVNAAIITGNVPTIGTGTTQYSGGVHNLTRLLENWNPGTAVTLWLNTSIINLYPSAQATGQFLQPSAYYNAPNRQFSFNLNYTNSTGLPPGTPLIDRMIRADWGIAPPNVVNYYSPTLDFVPH